MSRSCQRQKMSFKLDIVCRMSIIQVSVSDTDTGHTIYEAYPSFIAQNIEICTCLIDTQKKVKGN